MDSKRFSSKSPGKLVPISHGERDVAFIPDPLPREWFIDAEMWPLLAQAKEELARLDGLGRAVPDPDLLLRPLQQREALRSSSLEGTYATPQELLLFEMNPEAPTRGDERRNDWLEVSNYAAALRHGTKLLGSLPLSLRLIREMHEVLLHGVRGRDRAPGEFRRTQVHIGSDRRYVPPPPSLLASCLDDFERFLHESDQIDPLVRAFLAHYQFEAIHPFIDGNGRVGRALLSLCVLEWCGLSRPWLYVSPFFDRYKDAYIDALFSVSTDGDWNRWITLCLKATIAVCRDAIRRCDELCRLRQEYHRIADSWTGRMHRLIDGLFSNPIVSIPSLEKQLGVTYPTAKADVERLVEAKILTQLARARPRAFYAPAIFDVAYSEEP
ncbi:MAG TPA: Fic family protein [Thermoanaerobaculia bacterium]|nr:Fic family protein [Thermoanaerobaculia bacterium]